MNIELSKQVLSAQFASIYRDFETVPIAITNLHHDLESFRIKSRELETGSGQSGGRPWREVRTSTHQPEETRWPTSN